MAVSSLPVFLRTPKLGLVQIANADTTTLKTIVTAGADGSKVLGALVHSDDTAAKDVQIGVERGGTFYPLATVTIPLRSGDLAGTPPIDLFPYILGLPVDNDGQPFLPLVSGDTLKIKALVTLTSAKLISVKAPYGDY